MKIAFLYDGHAPYEGERPCAEDLAALAQCGAVLSFDQAGALRDYQAVVNLHGAYFPKDAFAGIKALLQTGAGLVTVGGGTPFSRPVRAGGQLEREQSAYHEQLNIHHALPICASRYDRLRVNADLPLLKGYEGCFEVADTVGLLVRFTSLRDVPTDDGPGGPMDANMIPLLRGYDGDERPMAAPVVMVENTKGAFAGGRWLFVNQRIGASFWQGGGAALLCALAHYVAHGVVECIVQPNYACYYAGEQPALSVRLQRLGGEELPASLRMSIAQGGRDVWQGAVAAATCKDSVYRTLPTDVRAQKGLYEVTTVLTIQGEPDRVLHNGFWGYDQALLEGGEELTCGRDYFQRGDAPHPVVGMTYMQSDVHRKFLDFPNPYIVNADMAEMRRAGINMVRTGIWTGHRTYGFVDGTVKEEALRAFDAYCLTAKLNDMPLVFNFFSFTPEPWEGQNCYLDPRSVEAQKRFIAAFVSRCKDAKGISWDLINEPSLSTLHTQWRPAPNGDPYEMAAWHKWLGARHGSIEELQERWNISAQDMPSFEAATLPSDVDMNDAITFTQKHKPLKVVDYLLFHQYVHNQWAQELYSAIRATGTKAPITVGQDEGLGAKRPSPLFYQEVMDYTTCHSWWLNDDLYWDGIFAKDVDKPCLIQETGIMYVQGGDGRPRRTQEELRAILERKYALSFAADGAGAVHWLWNINTYMDNFNEINIGAIFADGSQKLEADVSYDFGAFIRKTASLFRGRALPQTSIVYPYSNDFSTRGGAQIATRHAARVLGYDLGLPVQAYGEYHLDRLPQKGLILLPCARSLSQKAWDVLMDRARAGATLLLTGPLSYDEYYLRNDARAKELALDTQLRRIAREETLWIEGEPHRLSFPGNMLEWVDKECVAGSARDEVTVCKVGKGQVLFAPLPVELSPWDEPVVKTYQMAMRYAGVEAPFVWDKGQKIGLLAKKLEFAQGSVWIVVSECAQDEAVALTDRATGKTYSGTVPAQRCLLFGADAKGDLVASYRDLQVTAK